MTDNLVSMSLDFGVSRNWLSPQISTSFGLTTTAFWCRTRQALGTTEDLVDVAITPSMVV